MIYGRRFFEKRFERPVVKKGPKQFKLVHRGFQLKYMLFLCASMSLSSLLFLGPALYFLNQNYEIFRRIAFDTHSGLISHLEREVVWLTIFAAVSLIVIMISAMLIGLRLTAMLIGPLLRLEKHMKNVTFGDWSSPDFTVRDSDEYRSVFDSYSYMYRSLRAQTLAELKLLEKLAIDPNNKEASAIWYSLVSSKKQQLNIKTDSVPISSVDVASTGAIEPQRRAS
jgi:hypothetical protein